MTKNSHIEAANEDFLEARDAEIEAIAQKEGISKDEATAKWEELAAEEELHLDSDSD
ncbi:MAG TPA: hypothetical protein PLA93_09210 [Acinetobacter towneri]|uniref:hypothetical protein n=1 Tax=Acinetobacter towneri TaxID=202956 RepID=UPI002C1CC930|nr:hypothetical protein [Acinetobacter towneri]